MLTFLFWRIVAFFYRNSKFMYIVAIAWIYVVLMMSITEQSIIAGIMTFLMYGVLPLTIILYLMRTPHRRRQRQATEQLQNQANQVTESTSKKDPETLHIPPE